MTRTQKILTLASASVLLLTNLKTLGEFFDVPSMPLRIAGLASVAVFIVMALRERQPSHFHDYEIHAISAKHLRLLLWSTAVSCALAASSISVYVYWLSDKLAVARYRSAMATQHAHFDLHAKSLTRPITRLVMPRIITHESFRAVLDYRDVQEELLIGGGLVDTAPPWVFGFAAPKHDSVIKVTPLSIRSRGTEVERAAKETTISALTRTNRHVLIMGRPGTSLLHLRRYVTYTNAIDKSAKIPVVIRANSLTSPAALVPTIQARLADYGWPATAKVVGKHLRSGGFLVLVDGLEAIGDVHELDAVTNVLADLTRLYPAAAIFIFCDSRFVVRPVPGYTLAELVGYAPVQQDEFARIFFDNPLTATQFISELNTRPRLRPLATSPLLLALICSGFEESGVLPDEAAAFYDIVIDTLMDDRNSVAPMDREATRQILSALAFRTLKARSNTINDVDLRRTVADLSGNDVRAARYNDVVTSGLLMRAARNRYAFVHPTLQDYLAADHVHQMDARAALELLDQHAGDYLWQQVIIFAGASRGPRFLRSMLDAPDDLFSTRHYLVDQILRSGLVASPPSDLVERMIAFHERMLRSRYALQRYRSFSAMVDWIFARRADPIADELLNKRRYDIGDVLSALNDPDHNVRRKAARYVAKLQEFMDQEASTKSGDSEALFNMFLQETGSADARREILAHAPLTDLRVDKLKNELEKACDVNDPTRHHTYEVLIQRNKDEAMIILMAALLNEPTDEMRERIGNHLVNKSVIQDAMRELTAAEPLSTTLYAASAMHMALPAAFTTKALSSPDESVRAAALTYIAKRKDISYARRLRRDLDGTTSLNERTRIIYALADMGVPPPEAELRILVHHREAGVRSAAVYALAAHGTESAKLLVRGALTDTVEGVRRMAVEAAGRMRDQVAVKRITVLLQTASESVPTRMACVQALAAMSNNNAKRALAEHARKGPYPTSLLAMLASGSDRLDEKNIEELLARREDFQTMFLVSLLQDTKYLPDVMKRFAKSKRTGERLTCAMEATLLEDDVAVAILEPLLHDSVTPISDAAYVSLYLVSRRSGIRVPSAMYAAGA